MEELPEKQKLVSMISHSAKRSGGFPPSDLCACPCVYGFRQHVQPLRVSAHWPVQGLTELELLRATTTPQRAYSFRISRVASRGTQVSGLEIVGLSDCAPVLQVA